LNGAAVGIIAAMIAVGAIMLLIAFGKWL